MVGAWRSELPPLSHRDINLLPSLFPPGKVRLSVPPVLEAMGWQMGRGQPPPLAYLCELYREHRLLR